MLAAHLDPSIPLSLEDIERLKPGTVARLRKNGRAHMGRARRLNAALQALNLAIENPRFHHPMIEIVDFDPIEVYAAANWTCGKCFKRVDVTKGGQHPDSCVLGHANNLANGGGHTPKNCGPWHFACNAKAAYVLEIPREAKVKRLRETKLNGKKPSKNPIRSKPFGESRSFSNKAPSRWPRGRKIQSKNNLRRD